MKENKTIVEQQVDSLEFEEETVTEVEDKLETFDEADSNAVDVQIPTARAYRKHRRSKPVATPLEDSTCMYLREIGEIPLLTAREETKLAIKYEAGVKAAAQLEAADAGELDLAPRDRRRLCRVKQVGEDAKQQLIEANLRLVVSIAKRYKGSDMPLLDRVQEGNLGLIRAIEKFDHTKGFRLSTYSTHWIRQSISRSLADKSRTIRLPVHVVETLNKLSRIERQLELELNRVPSDEEVAVAMDISVDKLDELRRIQVKPISLETPVGDQEDSMLADFIPDAKADDPEAMAEDAAIQKAVAELLSTLSERDAKIIELRYGLGNNRPHTLEEVGHEFGVTRERIRQIEKKTLAQLRHPERSFALRGFLGK